MTMPGEEKINWREETIRRETNSEAISLHYASSGGSLTKGKASESVEKGTIFDIQSTGLAKLFLLSLHAHILLDWVGCGREGMSKFR